MAVLHEWCRFPAKTRLLTRNLLVGNDLGEIDRPLLIRCMFRLMLQKVNAIALGLMR